MMQVESKSVEQSSVKFHPDFASEEADVILACKESALHFRVPSFTLRSTSGFFATMFTLPQSSSQGTETMYLEEDADVLELLLRMACGLSFPDITTLDLLEGVIYAAEKYDMSGPMSILRLFLLSPALPDDPFRLYAIARRHGWQEVAKTLSTRTLSLHIWDPKYKPALKTASSEALLDLFILHRSRKDHMKEMLNDPPFVTGDPTNCIQCNGFIDNSTWRELKYRILKELDDRPQGNTILDPGMATWPEAVACWKASCGNAGCNRLLYDKEETIRVIRECLGKLRNSI